MNGDESAANTESRRSFSVSLITVVCVTGAWVCEARIGDKLS